MQKLKVITIDENINKILGLLQASPTDSKKVGGRFGWLLTDTVTVVDDRMR
jgi:hypothetical protein